MKRYRLGSICKILSGSTPKTGVPEYWNGDRKWITPAELSESSYVVCDTDRKLTGAGVKSAGLTPLPEGTVILSSRAPIGKVAIAGCEMYCNQGFKNLVCSEHIYNKYLYWYLKSKTDFLNSLGRGATFKEISKTIVSEIELAVPEYSEQVEKVIRLEKLQSVITHRRSQLAKLDELVKCRFVELFGDAKNNPYGWVSETFGSIAEEIIGGVSVSGEARKIQKGELAVLKVSAVTYGVFKCDEYKVIPKDIKLGKYVSPKKGDLLFSRANTKELVGATALVDKDYPQLLLPDKIWKIVVRDKVSPVYLKAYLSEPWIRELMSKVATGTSGSMYNISMEKLRQIPVILPPIEKQNAFAAFVRRIDKLRFVIQQSLDETQKLFDSLMQEYFD